MELSVTNTARGERTVELTHYQRGFETQAGKECSVEQALVEMYLAGVRVRRFEGIPETLQGTRTSPSTVSNQTQKIYAQIKGWRNRKLEGK